MSEIKMMKCGHSAHAKDGNGNPCCAICSRSQGSHDIADLTPDLSNRESKCSYRSCNTVSESSSNLPFFKHQPEQEFDQHYCGCYGWD